MNDLDRLRKKSRWDHPARLAGRIAIVLVLLAAVVVGLAQVPWGRIADELRATTSVPRMALGVAELVVFATLGCVTTAWGLRFPQAEQRLRLVWRITAGIGVAAVGWLVWLFAQEGKIGDRPWDWIGGVILGVAAALLVTAAILAKPSSATTAATASAVVLALAAIGLPPETDPALALAGHGVLGLWLGGLIAIVSVLAAGWFSRDPIRTGIAADRIGTATGWWLFLLLVAVGVRLVARFPRVLEGVIPAEVMRIGISALLLALVAAVALAVRRRAVRAVTEAAVVFAEARDARPDLRDRDLVAHHMRTAAGRFTWLRAVTVAELCLLSVIGLYGIAAGM